MKLSIVVPVRKARVTLEQTIASLLLSCKGIDAEVLVAYASEDETCEIVEQLQGVRLLRANGKYSVPQLRRDGVRAAQGEFVLITEDHCTVAPDWAAKLLAATGQHPASGWGGPVINARESWLGWTHYLTRYTAFLPPGKAAYTRHLPGNNALYRKDDLLSLATEFADGFWEAEFNVVLTRERGPFWYTPEAPVKQQQQRGLIEYASLRYRHGRCYGARCGKPHSAIFFFVAALLFWRGLRASVNNGLTLRFALSSPLLAVYYAGWAAGEMVGYIAGAGDSCSDTD